jgi:hypothetical protein
MPKILESQVGSTWESIASVPIGTILPFNGGYFTSSVNSGFTDAIGSSVATINSRLNVTGFYVCDGSSLNIPGSPVFNGAGRFLPNLTDSRFLMGTNATGPIGGQNSVVLSVANLPSHTHTINHDHGSHTHSIDHDHGATATGAHTHTYARSATHSGDGPRASGTNGPFEANNGTGSTTPSIDLANFTGPSGPTGVSFVGSSGPTGSAASYDNRPIYLSVIYIQRVV